MTAEEAIKGLKSLVDVRKKYGDWQSMKDEIEALDMAIKALERSRWIPVSERLPEDEAYILTTIHIPKKEPKVRSGFYYKGMFQNDNGDCWNASDPEVKAWRYSPEPYKAESEVSDADID